MHDNITKLSYNSENGSDIHYEDRLDIIIHLKSVYKTLINEGNADQLKPIEDKYNCLITA